MFGFWVPQWRVRRAAAGKLYDAVMQQSRSPFFYQDCKIPDTMEGRFEVLVLHGGLLVNRLCRPDMGRDGRILAQSFFDVMFRNLEWSLREMGIGDLGVPRRVKKMMGGFKGRAFAYDEALKSGRGEIKHALIRNMYGTVGEPHSDELERMADYVSDCAARLGALGLSDVWQGKVEFPALGAVKDMEDKNENKGMQVQELHGTQEAA